MICPKCGAAVDTRAKPATLDEIKAAIDALPVRERTMLHPWLLATYDHAGVRRAGYPSEKQKSP